MYYLLFSLDFMKDKGDNLSSQLRGKNFLSWDLQKVPITQLPEAESTQNQFHFYHQVNCGKVYAKMSHT